ncbi:MAG: tandem-95 repeat protein, partial [Planctomycetales bacterium]|nr:tandem-95 repeat protein [Planctomycetales bacterium]
VSLPANGNLVLLSTGAFSYTPVAGFSGIDTFTYQAFDGLASSNTSTVTISVAATNHAPLTLDDNYHVNESSSLSVSAPGVLNNDTDEDGDVLEAQLVAGTSHGTLTLNANGSFLYSPNAGYVGPDQFVYQAFDGSLTSGLATATISVDPINEAPLGTDDTWTFAEDQTLDIAAPGILSNDTDPDGDVLSAQLVQAPQNGVLTLQADGSFTYTPNSNYWGTDSFIYLASDGTLQSTPVTVSLVIESVNDAPVGTSDSYSLSQDSTLTIPAPGVLGNDVDVDGDAITSVISLSTAHGSLSLATDGSFVYSPDPGFFGADQFAYRVSDGLLQSPNVLVSLDVQATSDGGTKFMVVDAFGRRVFGYDQTGNSTTDTTLGRNNKKARGIASSADGSTQWTVNADGEVFVYEPDGTILGMWRAVGIDKPEGITTDGTNIWIVDRETDRVFYFDSAAVLRSGEVRADSAFDLAPGNRNPKDLVTDGNYVWVVDDGRRIDAVYRYALDGLAAGNWQIDALNVTPTGITLDPIEHSSLWIVDASAHQVFQYTDALNRVSGQSNADYMFELNAGNRDPQGIADPPPVMDSNRGPRIVSTKSGHLNSPDATDFNNTQLLFAPSGIGSDKLDAEKTDQPRTFEKPELWKADEYQIDLLTAPSASEHDVALQQMFDEATNWDESHEVETHDVREGFNLEFNLHPEI